MQEWSSTGSTCKALASRGSPPSQRHLLLHGPERRLCRLAERTTGTVGRKQLGGDCSMQPFGPSFAFLLGLCEASNPKSTVQSLPESLFPIASFLPSSFSNIRAAQASSTKPATAFPLAMGSKCARRVFDDDDLLQMPSLEARSGPLSLEGHELPRVFARCGSVALLLFGHLISEPV